jgi:fatty-acid desaturase
MKTMGNTRPSDLHGLWTGIGLLFLHLGALLAFVPAFFSWSALGVAVLLYWATGAIGICLCYHRILTHKSLQVPKPLEYAMAMLGALALQGGPVEWVSTHRAHHAKSDREGDPHSARRGLRWAHMDWLYLPNEYRLSVPEQRRLAPDLYAQPYYRFLEKTAILWQIVLGLVLLMLGGMPWLVWGLFVRVTVTYHLTWFVNSAAHFSGYRSFRTGDLSTNNWWVALLAWGEGWHNNHHAFPFSARHGLRWFELDLTWLTIKFLAALRLARDIKIPTPAMMKRLALDAKSALDEAKSAIEDAKQAIGEAKSAIEAKPLRNRPAQR